MLFEDQLYFEKKDAKQLQSLEWSSNNSKSKHTHRIYLCQTLLKTLQVLIHVILTIFLQQGGAITTPIVQMSKLKQEKLRMLSKAAQLVRGRAKLKNQTSYYKRDSSPNGTLVLKRSIAAINQHAQAPVKSVANRLLPVLQKITMSCQTANEVCGFSSGAIAILLAKYSCLLIKMGDVSLHRNMKKMSKNWQNQLCQTSGVLSKDYSNQVNFESRKKGINSVGELCGI